MKTHNMNDHTRAFLSELNTVQQKAVQQTNGPVLILAGAGSGKTRVLTYRIAHLLNEGLARPSQILALTFTNKAAGEMRERVIQLVPGQMAGMWIGTFHSLWARLLRMEGERLGYGSNFTIYDQNDQVTLIKRILNEMHVSPQENPPKMVAHRISNAKNEMILPDQFQQSPTSPVDAVVAKVYPVYQTRLKDLNAMDFDDLLINPLALFERFPSVREFYQNKFQYILVDEYQDTNHAQYLALRTLAARHKNICVVGDDDQSIYRWRGADIRNILDFEKDYRNCAKFRLEQNYRSTQTILSAAHSVVRNNRQRHAKKLWTCKEGGEPVTVLEIENDLHEARMIAQKISMELRRGDYDFHDFSVLYRTNAQSRVIEEALRSESIPYIIVGGVKFYERKEIKDVLAYLKVITNPMDALSLRRILNYPLRGIGDATVGKLEALAYRRGGSLYNALNWVHDDASIGSRATDTLVSFYELLEKYRSVKEKLSPAELASSLVEEVGIQKQLKTEGTIESLTRLENVRELLLAIAEFSSRNGPQTTLEDYLENVSLTTDIDTWDDRSNAVTLMTMHSAKGLEFSIVFIVGLEEGLFPLSQSLSDPLALEEERRLFYVGATRAKQKLYFSWAHQRRRYGGTTTSVPSRFLKEVDAQYLDYNRGTIQHSTQQRRPVRSESPITQIMPNYEDESQEPIQFRVGMRVAHNTFGRGTILKIDPAGQYPKLIVKFDTAGKRRLILPHAKLEIL